MPGKASVTGFPPPRSSDSDPLRFSSRCLVSFGRVQADDIGSRDAERCRVAIFAPCLAWNDKTAKAPGHKAQVLDLGAAVSGVKAIRLTVAQGPTGTGETAGGFDEVAFAFTPAR